MKRDEESPVELMVAERVEQALRALGIEPGQRERHDAGAGPGPLRVDYCYPDARLPFALEVTTIGDGDHRSGTSASIKLMDRLSKAAELEQLGAWVVAVETTRNLRRLEATILELVREERTKPPRNFRRFGHYTSDDLLALPDDEARRRFIQREDEIRALGIVELNRLEQPTRPHVIGVLPMTGMREIGSFADWLQDCIDDNAEKLGEVPNGLERHLGVLVVRFDASTFPGETPIPELPAQIDALWVIYAWRQGRDRTTWHARRGDSEWTLIEMGAGDARDLVADG